MKLFTSLLLLIFLQTALRGQLKSVIYDFDGLDIGATDLPDGDFRNNDLTYAVTANPLAPGDVLGDRVLKLSLNWSAGFGEFGKTANRFIELNAGTDHLNFYFYNPASNSGNLVMNVNITEDDDHDDIFNGAADDSWGATVTVNQSGQWQLFSIPLNSFTDMNPGGNGIFDAAYTNAAGKIFSVSFILNKPAPASVSDEYYLDMICFSEGTLPHGSGILDLPYPDPNASALLGALGSSGSADQVPAEIQSYLPANKKLNFINWFIYYSNSGTTPNQIPGPEAQNLINAGYTPVITWEMMFQGFSRLDPAQPRLNNLLNGEFDWYIDAFANKIKSYSGTVVIRILHEFEGDWYCWSLTQNNNDASRYVAAYRHIVDRFRNLGANNVQWMWCVNAEPKPYVAYNWIVSCYPGDAYVDIVATDIYNHPDYGTPPWKSFRYTMAESYYYLSKYFPNKPLYICEVASRERDSSEPSGSQTKGQWLCQMNKDLQSYFNKTKAVIFFSVIKEHDWRINSSPAAQQAFTDCIWNDNFYKGAVDVAEINPFEDMKIFPNPFVNDIFFKSMVSDSIKNLNMRLYDIRGNLVINKQFNDLPGRLAMDIKLSAGVYILEMSNQLFTRKYKMIKAEIE